MPMIARGWRQGSAQRSPVFAGQAFRGLVKLSRDEVVVQGQRTGRAHRSSILGSRMLYRRSTRRLITM